MKSNMSEEKKAASLTIHVKFSPGRYKRYLKFKLDTDEDGEGNAACICITSEERIQSK